jgi:hypothetical protein
MDFKNFVAGFWADGFWAAGVWSEPGAPAASTETFSFTIF